MRVEYHGADRLHHTLVLLAQDEANTCIVSMLPDGGAEAKKVLFSPEPPPRMQAALAEIPGGVDLVLHGGRSNTGLLNDTWLLQDGGWQALDCRRSSGLEHDLIPFGNGRLLLVGGSTDAGPLNSLWLFSNRSWSPMAWRPVLWCRDNVRRPC